MNAATETQLPPQNEPSRNPYVGPVPFEEKDRDFFFGRDHEIAILQGLVLASRTMLFFAQSGAGKSSLLRAGVIPELTRQQRQGRGERATIFQPMQVLPIVRVSGISSATTTTEVDNPYVFNTLLRLLPHLTSQEIAKWTVTDGLRNYRSSVEEDKLDPSILPAFALPELDRANATLLIFDQFEEIFTTYPEQWQERTQFFQQVAKALLDFPFLHVLFTMREDYLAELTPYAALLPEQLQHRYRMERMKRNVALLAVREPASRAGRTFAEGVAEALVDNLARVQIVQRKRPVAESNDTSFAPFVVGDYVEPVHLQIVCHQLWEKLDPQRQIIVQADVQALGNVDQALTDFYEDVLSRITQSHQLSERTLRDWFGQQLITSARTRGLLYRDEATGKTETLPNAVVDDLRNSYLVRSSERGGDIWIELAHDRLVEPILSANQRWYDALANPMTSALNRWQVSGRQDAYLLKKDALATARAFVEQHRADVSQEESEFFEASLQIAQREHEAQQRLRTLIVSASIASLLLAILSIYAIVSNKNAQVAKLRNQSIQIARLAEQKLTENQLDLALLLSIESVTRQETADAVSVLHTIFSHPGYLVRQLSGHTKLINHLIWSRDGKRLVSASDDATVVIWEAETGKILNRLPHDDNVLNARWNADESQLLTWTRSGIVRLWDMAKAAPLVEFRDPNSKKAIQDAQWSPDEMQIASASQDGHIRIWSVETGEMLADYSLYQYAALSVIWGEDNHSLWVAGTNEIDNIQQIKIREHDQFLPQAQVQRIISDTNGIEKVVWNGQQTKALTVNYLQPGATIWNLETGQAVRVLQDVVGNARFAAWSPDGTQILVSDESGYALIFDIAGKLMKRLHSHSDFVKFAEWNSDGSQILTISNDGVIIIWNAKEGAVRAEFHVSDSNHLVSAASLQQSDHLLAIADGQGLIRLWSTKPLDELPLLQGHSKSVYTARLNQASTQLLTADAGGKVNIWDIKTSKVITSFDTGATLFQAKWSRDEQSVLTALDDGSARLLDVGSGQVRATINSGDLRVEYALWLSLHSHLYIYTGSAISTTQEQQINNLNPWRVLVWDTDSLNAPILALEGHTQKIQSAFWSENQQRIATASDDGTVRIWNAGNGQLQQIITHSVGLTNPVGLKVYWAEWVHNDQNLLTWSEDGTARLWNTTSWKPIFTFAHETPLTSAVWDDIQTLLVTGAADGTVRIWSLTLGKLIAQLDGHTAPVRVLVLSHDETKFLSADEDGFVRVWELATGKSIANLSGHQDQVYSAAWNQTDTQILTASADGTARLWDAENGVELASLGGHVGAVLGATWIENEKVVMTRGADGTVRRYFTQPRDLLAAACTRAVRNLTQEEWNRYVGSEKRRATCSQLPLE